MLFHTFCSQEERRSFGGSAFIELQYCRLPVGTGIKELVAVDSIHHWQDDSLYIYIDDDNAFYQEYARFFDCGTYNNLQTGPVDPYGINYYEPSQVEPIMEGILKMRPTEYETVVEWLKKSGPYNGFYILGL